MNGGNIAVYCASRAKHNSKAIRAKAMRGIKMYTVRSGFSWHQCQWVAPQKRQSLITCSAAMARMPVCGVGRQQRCSGRAGRLGSNRAHVQHMRRAQGKEGVAACQLDWCSARRTIRCIVGGIVRAAAACRNGSGLGEQCVIAKRGQPGAFKLAGSTVDRPPLCSVAAVSPKHQMLESPSSAQVASSAVLTATKLRLLSPAHAGSVGSVSRVRGVIPWPLPGDSPQHSRAELLSVSPQVWL